MENSNVFQLEHGSNEPQNCDWCKEIIEANTEFFFIEFDDDPDYPSQYAFHPECQAAYDRVQALYAGNMGGWDPGDFPRGGDTLKDGIGW